MLDDNTSHYKEKYSVQLVLYTLKTKTEWMFLAGGKGGGEFISILYWNTVIEK